MAMDADSIIRRKLRIKGVRGSLPWMGWNKQFSRDSLARLFNKLGYKTGAEIGVNKGAYSQVLCTKIPGVELYCIDTWAPYNKRKSQASQDACYVRAQRALRGFDVTFIRKASLDAVKDFADGSLDFVYIDAMHDFDNVIMDIINWSPKVRIGGIVSGHDYIKRDSQGVAEAVNAYTAAHYINPWYITGHNLDDRTNSFFWVKK